MTTTKNHEGGDGPALAIGTCEPGRILYTDGTTRRRVSRMCDLYGTGYTGAGDEGDRCPVCGASLPLLLKPGSLW